MKKTFTLVLFFGIMLSARATIVTITCQNVPSHFLPITANATVGDTIHWTWVAGTHIVGPETTADIPAGAAMFNAPIDAGHLSFEYVVTVAGSYHYVCHPSTPHGEDAYLSVAPASGIQQYSSLSNISKAYPNPFVEKITIEASNADRIIVYDALGKVVRSFPLKSGQTKFELDLGALPKGMFFYTIISDGAVLETRKIIKL